MSNKIEPEALAKREKMINFYELAEMKKFMPQIKDEQKHFTGMPLDQHFILVGGTGSGKTNSLLNYLHRTSQPKKGTFDHVIMCVMKMEGANHFLQEKLGDKLSLFLGLDKFPPVSDFPDLSKTNDSQFLVVFDDCVNEKNLNNVNKILQYFTYGRSKGITVIYLTQGYYRTPIFIRQQVSFILLCSIKSNRELKSILKDYDISNVTDEQLVAMYEYSQQKDEPTDITFLKICTYECPRNKKFSRMFLEYLDPDTF
jgi:hypothetical protein